MLVAALAGFVLAAGTCFIGTRSKQGSSRKPRSKSTILVLSYYKGRRRIVVYMLLRAGALCPVCLCVSRSLELACLASLPPSPSP